MNKSLLAERDLASAENDLLDEKFTELCRLFL